MSWNLTRDGVFLVVTLATFSNIFHIYLSENKNVPKEDKIQ